MEVSLSVFLRRVLVSFFLPFLLLTTLLPAYAQEALVKELIGKAGALYQQGRYAEAAKVAKEALKVAENTFGPDDLGVGISLSFLGRAYKEQGKYAAAEPLFERSMAIYE